MHTYSVVDNWADESHLGLRCQVGRYHLARALHDSPPLGARLNGAKPHLGFGVLVCPQSGAIFRVIFELINHADPSFGGEWIASGLSGARARDGQIQV